MNWVHFIIGVGFGISVTCMFLGLFLITEIGLGAILGVVLMLIGMFYMGD